MRSSITREVHGLTLTSSLTELFNPKSIKLVSWGSLFWKQNTNKSQSNQFKKLTAELQLRIRKAKEEGTFPHTGASSRTLSGLILRSSEVLTQEEKSIAGGGSKNCLQPNLARKSKFFLLFLPLSPVGLPQIDPEGKKDSRHRIVSNRQEWAAINRETEGGRREEAAGASVARAKKEKEIRR